MTARAAKADGTQERIVESAMAFYFERPIDDFTLDAVADRAETTVQTVLRAFGSKDDLLFAALGEMAASGVCSDRRRRGISRRGSGDFRSVRNDRRFGHPAPQTSAGIQRSSQSSITGARIIANGSKPSFAPQLARSAAARARKSSTS